MNVWSWSSVDVDDGVCGVVFVFGFVDLDDDCFCICYLLLDIEASAMEIVLSIH